VDGALAAGFPLGALDRLGIPSLENVRTKEGFGEWLDLAKDERWIGLRVHVSRSCLFGLGFCCPDMRRLKSEFRFRFRFRGWNGSGFVWRFDTHPAPWHRGRDGGWEDGRVQRGEQARDGAELVQILSDHADHDGHPFQAGPPAQGAAEAGYVGF
jgi:hypothetical protein